MDIIRQSLGEKSNSCVADYSCPQRAVPKLYFEIADTLLLDKDDMVQKGYGWMLKATSEANQKRVFEYVMSKKGVMPRTSLRYAIEKMPQELRTKAMAK